MTNMLRVKLLTLLSLHTEENVLLYYQRSHGVKVYKLLAEARSTVTAIFRTYLLQEYFYV
jgi:hypothetical protein